ncbi:serine/threonine protein kinase [Alkalispirochaeta americana]|uniref:non-specific serine/threonine protein kinase n=1 Tax=Alkalispirochaeta americana TaxID=159291 RepID=A0A1N6NL13_9SPIO|nr:serine/threonine-protein kinase [Alkalispirochaeta americana]SIP92785.1 serine/threonine protein kinase [Alkalispirochaeta americana]
MAKTVETIGKYQVLQRLAQGGMGAVYTARHPTLDRTVIIKKLTLRGSADMRERFRREAQIMMDLRNDAIVDVYDHFREGSSYYIVLEYVEGVSLEELIRQHRYLSEDAALLILREVCRALAYAHERGVVHRDIKPANILISSRGEVKLVDFGIATIHGGEEESALTREGMTLGTPSYMAPEQFQNTRSVDHRADIYSVGVVLYEMVTGKRPYPGTFSPEVISLIQKGRYPRPRKLNPQVSLFTARMIGKMLKPLPARRFADLNQVIRRINRRLGLRPHGRTDSLVEACLEGEVLRVRPRRRGRVIAAAGLVAVGLLALVVAGGLHRGLHREFFQADAWGALDVTARVRRTGLEAEDIFLRGTLFKDDGDGIPALEEGALRFSAQAVEETPQYFLFRAERRHLPPGSYRAKIEAGTALWWHSFEVPPLREGPRHLAADFLDLPELPLEVTFDVRDRESGRRLTDEAEIFLFLENRRLPWSEEAAARLRSGRVYRFQFRLPGYREQLFSLAIGPEQARLHLQVHLEPLKESP